MLVIGVVPIDPTTTIETDGCVDNRLEIEAHENTPYLTKVATAKEASTMVKIEIFLSIIGLYTRKCITTAINPETTKAPTPIRRKFSGKLDEITAPVYAPIVRNSAWAKFGNLTTASVRVSPRDASTYMLPMKIERTIESTSHSSKCDVTEVSNCYKQFKTRSVGVRAPHPE